MRRAGEENILPWCIYNLKNIKNSYICQVSYRYSHAPSQKAKALIRWKNEWHFYEKMWYLHYIHNFLCTISLFSIHWTHHLNWFISSEWTGDDFFKHSLIMFSVISTHLPACAVSFVFVVLPECYQLQTLTYFVLNIISISWPKRITQEGFWAATIVESAAKSSCRGCRGHWFFWRLV